MTQWDFIYSDTSDGFANIDLVVSAGFTPKPLSRSSSRPGHIQLDREARLATNCLLARQPTAQSADIIWGLPSELPFCSEADRLFDHWMGLLDARGGLLPHRRDFENFDCEAIRSRLRISKLDADGQIRILMLGPAADISGGRLRHGIDPSAIFSDRVVEVSSVLHQLVLQQGACLMTRYTLQLDCGRLIDMEAVMMPVCDDQEILVLGATGEVGGSHRSAPLILPTRAGKIDMVGQLAARILHTASDAVGDARRL